MNIRIAIVEDDHEIRETLGMIINASNGFICEHLYPDAESALKKLPEQAVHVVLMDIELPGISGIEAVRILNPKMEGTDFIMLT